MHGVAAVTNLTASAPLCAIFARDHGSSILLLARALAEQTNTALAAKLRIHLSLFSQARNRGRLSAILASRVVALLGENVTHWIALAALEAARLSPLRDAQLRTIRAGRRP